MRPALGVALAALAAVTPAVAQPTPCAACARGDAVIDRWSLQPLRAIAGELVAPLGDPLTADEYARVVAIRTRAPAFVKLGALDDAELLAIAASLCSAARGTCVDATARTLRCVADQCVVDLPREHHDVEDRDVARADRCRYARSLPYRLGFDVGTGWQRSRYPSDGGAWSLGVEGQLRFSDRFGVVARVDRIEGRDEATDLDGDGRDDTSTGSITRIAVLAGPSLVLDEARYEQSIRFLRLDLLAGYLVTRSQPDERGPAAGIDLAYQVGRVNMGVRFVQAFGAARDASMLIAHIGLVDGRRGGDEECSQVPERSSSLALGLEVPFLGYGISEQLGYLAAGFGIEPILHLSGTFDAVTHADVLFFPGYHRDRVIQQAVLAGLRLDHTLRYSKPLDWWSATAMAGYSHGIGLTPTSVGSGPVVDLSLAGGGEEDRGVDVYLRLHGRFGLGSENRDYRAVFLSVGMQLGFGRDRARRVTP